MAGNTPLSNLGTVVDDGKPGPNPNYTKPLVVLTSLFFMWGFLTCMNDILIPALKEVFELDYFQAFLVNFAFFGAYFIGSLIYFGVSVNYGDPINKMGYKNGIIAGLLISAISCALFYPAAEFKVYGYFLTALFLLGIGFTLLQIAANPYVSILGTEETASSRLNLSQGFNSFGTTIAPLIGGYLIFEYFAEEGGMLTADSVKIPYLVFAATFLLLAVIIKITYLPRFTNEESLEKGAGALKYPHLVLGMFAIFFYVGGEVSIGSMLINFFEQEEIMGLAKNEGDIFLAFYWGGAMTGRFIGAISLSGMDRNLKKFLIMVGVGLLSFGVIYFSAWTKSGFTLEITQVLPFLLLILLNLVGFVIGRSLPGRTLGVFATINMLLLLVTVTTGGAFAFWTVIGIGLFNSIMWSNIFTLAIDGLGKHKSQGSSLLVMMILGGALIPPLQGKVADLFNNAGYIGEQLSFAIPVVCYLYLAFYGYKGYKAGRHQEVDLNPLKPS